MSDNNEALVNQLQMVTFNLVNEEFGVDILKVHEIIRIMELTKVPNAPAFVDGIINLRGKVIPIIDLRARFNLHAKEHDSQTRIVVMDIQKSIIGFIVDGVSQVRRISKDTIVPPPPVVAAIDSDYMMGVAKLEDRLIILLDLDKLLGAEEIHALSGI